jgi:hypothetical protein
MRGAIPEGALQLQHSLAGAIAFEPLMGYRCTGDIPEQAFEFPALIGGTTVAREVNAPPSELAPARKF